MKTLGLIGGMSWESTTLYYQLLNRIARDRLGGQHSASLVLWSVDFAPIARMQSAGLWDEATAVMVDAARRLERAGAEAIVICANTMHRMADDVAAAISIPLIHVADATAGGDHAPPACAARCCWPPASPWSSRSTATGCAGDGVEALIPAEPDRSGCTSIIFDELVQGRFKLASKDGDGGDDRERRARRGRRRGDPRLHRVRPAAEAGRPAVPTFDTAELHARAAMDFALADREHRRESRPDRTRY